MPDADISHVSDTARWVATYRAHESERADAVFHDPFARRLAGPRGEAITKEMDRRYAADWPMVVRTKVIDEVLLRCIADERITQVLNLAAGLDARPWRLELPASLRWVDVDHAVMLDEKTAELRDEPLHCDYEAVRLDLADRDARRTLFARLAAGGHRTLVITEGLLVYLDAAAVRDLADDLAAARGFDLWLMDLASPALLKLMERSWGSAVAKGDAPFKFGPPEHTAFFARHGWREREWHSMVENGLRLDRIFPFARIWMLVGRFFSARKREEFRRFSGMALLERA